MNISLKNTPSGLQNRVALRYSLFIILLAISLPLFSQTDKERAEEFRLQAEQRKRTEVLQVFDSAIRLTENGEYELADKKLMYVLNNVKSVPSDLTFHFGRNSFYLGKFKQSIDWLNKYIQLKGPSGQYYNEAIDLLKQSEIELVNERAKEAKKVEQIFSNSFEIDCGPTGKVICPVCKGNTVIIKKGYLSDEYKTCPYCDTHGNLTCEEYNQLLRGELKPKR